MTEKSSGTTIAAVDKALAILNLFSEQQIELGITEMAQLTGLHKSTLAGLVYTLERNGYLYQNVESRKYRLGLRLAERAAVALNQYQVVAAAQKHMETLLNKRNESVNFGVREGAEVVYLAHLTSNQQLNVRVKIGKRGHLHTTALGKAILSVTPETVRRQIIDTLTLEPMTPHTITTVAGLMDDLNRGAARGYSIDNEENELGGRCVAAPIFDWTGRVIGAISLSAPITRFPVERVQEFGNDIIETANAISAEMGYRTVSNTP